MNHRIGLGLVVAGVLGLANVATAQDVLIAAPPAGKQIDPLRNGSTYGTSWGEAGFGARRLYSEFSSPYGAGYGYGYAPTGFVPNPWGMGLWRPGANINGTTYGLRGAYRTFPYPYPAGKVQYGPPIGVYAPGFGPGTSPVP